MNDKELRKYMKANHRNEQRKLWNQKLKEAGLDARYIVEAEGVWIESEQPWIESEEVWVESEELEIDEEAEVIEVAEEDWKQEWVEEWGVAPAEETEEIWDMLVEKTTEEIANEICEAWSGTTYS